MIIATAGSGATLRWHRTTSLAFFVVLAAAFVYVLLSVREWLPLLILGALTVMALIWVLSVARKAGAVARYGAYLDLETPVAPGSALQATVHFRRWPVASPARLMVSLECWQCYRTGQRIEKLWSARQVVEVTRTKEGAEARVRFDIPGDAPRSNMPAALRTPPDRAILSSRAYVAERFTLWEIAVTSGLREVDVDHYFHVPGVGEEAYSGAVTDLADAGAWEASAPRLAWLPVVALIAANLVPVAGVLYFGWRVRDVVMLYWMENLVIGAYNMLRIATLNADRFQHAGVPASRLMSSLFFMGHYGMFCMVHGVFLAQMFFDRSTSIDEVLGDMLRDRAVVFALVALIASHGVSFVRHHLAGGERDRLDPNQLMMRPYGRIVVTHFLILVGGLLVMRGQGHLGPLLLLVGMKVLLDLVSHYVGHAGPLRPRGS